MPKPATYRSELPDRLVDLIRFRCKKLPVYGWPCIRRQHGADFAQRQSGRLAQRNQCQLIEYTRRKTSPKALSANRYDQSLFFVIAQCRRRNARALGDFGNIHVVQLPLDLKLTSTSIVDSSSVQVN